MNLDENRWKWFLQASRTFLNSPGTTKTSGNPDLSDAYFFENASEKFGFPEVFVDPGRFRKVREACRNHFHLFSSKFIARISSYDQKPSEVHDH